MLDVFFLPSVQKRRNAEDNYYHDIIHYMLS